LAFTKKKKDEMIDLYEQWLADSQAILMVEYKHMTMKEVDSLRVKVRETGSRAHVVKNTLWMRALDKHGIQHDELTGTTLVGVATGDVAALAKVFTEAARGSEVFKLKGGYMDKRQLSSQEVSKLAELPPLPVMRARLLGLLQTPAGQLVRTLAEPARRLAAVTKAYSEKAAATA
jgi:large subunit ribosomal protein L10